MCNKLQYYNTPYHFFPYLILVNFYLHFLFTFWASNACSLHSCLLNTPKLANIKKSYNKKFKRTLRWFNGLDQQLNNKLNNKKWTHIGKQWSRSSLLNDLAHRKYWFDITSWYYNSANRWQCDGSTTSNYILATTEPRTRFKDHFGT